MSLLVSAEDAEFPYIKEQTGATAGNLSVQVDKLSAAGYIEVEKTFKGKKPCTICRITPIGLKAFEDMWSKFFLIFYSSKSKTVALLAACAPMTNTCAMSAVFDGPLIKVPYP